MICSKPINHICNLDVDLNNIHELKLFIKYLKNELEFFLYDHSDLETINHYHEPLQLPHCLVHPVAHLPTQTEES